MGVFCTLAASKEGSHGKSHPCSGRMTGSTDSLSGCIPPGCSRHTQHITRLNLLLPPEPGDANLFIKAR